MNDKALTIIPRSIDEVTDLAERLSKSTLLPKAMVGKAADVLVTVLAGQELGLSPMASLRAIHVIDGMPRLSADGMIAIVLGSGKAKYFTRVEESDTAVTYETCRVGTDTPRRCTWTMEMAKRAGIHLRDNWRAFPRAMLAARAKSELARDVFGDILLGCYTPDEIEGGAPPTKHADIPDAEIVSETTEPPELAQIDTAATLEELNALAPALGKLSPEWKKVARARWSAREGLLPKAGSAA